MGKGNAGDPSIRARIVLTDGVTGDQFVQNASEIPDFIEHFVNVGDREDAWQAIGLASDNKDVSRAGGNSIAYVFRENAAVQFIVVSDEIREKNFFEGNSGGTAIGGSPMFKSVLEGLYAENLPTPALGAVGTALDDAVVTMVAPFDFTESAFGALDGDIGNDVFVSETVLGVDVHRLDDLNLDRNSRIENGDNDSSGPNEYAVFKYRDFDDENDGDNFVWVDDTRTASFLDSEWTYGEIKEELENPCDIVSVDNCFIGGDVEQPMETEGTYNPFFPDPNVQRYVQESFGSEEEAFTAWEARGTAWDYEVIRAAFRRVGSWIGDSDNFLGNVDNFVGFDDPLSVFSQFNRAFVDDTFEKILLQTIDLDRIVGIPAAVADNLYSVTSNGGIEQGYISASDIDVMTYYLLNAPEASSDSCLFQRTNERSPDSGVRDMPPRGNKRAAS